jgi:hypothetical protein
MKLFYIGTAAPGKAYNGDRDFAETMIGINPIKNSAAHSYVVSPAEEDNPVFFSRIGEVIPFLQGIKFLSGNISLREFPQSGEYGVLSQEDSKKILEGIERFRPRTLEIACQ